MNSNSFQLTELLSFLEQLVVLLWSVGFKTDVCGDTLHGCEHPLELVKVTHPAVPCRSFQVVSTPENVVGAGPRFNVRLEFGGDMICEAFFGFDYSAEEVFAVVVRKFFAFDMEEDAPVKPPADHTRWTQSEKESPLVMERGDDQRRTNGNFDLGVRLYKEHQQGDERGHWCHDFISAAHRLHDLFRQGIITSGELYHMVLWLKKNVYFYSDNFGYNPNE
jgi:hypothetical protein